MFDPLPEWFELMYVSAIGVEPEPKDYPKVSRRGFTTYGDAEDYIRRGSGGRYPHPEYFIVQDPT